MYQTIEVTVSLEVTPCVSEDKCMIDKIEPEMDALELQFWPLMSDFIQNMRLHGVNIEPNNSVPDASEPDASEPYVKQTFSFFASYKFMANEPETAI